MDWRRACLLLGLFSPWVACARGKHAAPTEPTAPTAPNAAGAAGSSAPAAPAPPPARPDLTLLYTSDLRGRVSADVPGTNGGLSRRATLVDRIKLEGRPVIQVDAGDLLAGAGDDDLPHTVYERGRRTPIILTSYNRMGIDAVTLGERELELGTEPLKAAVKAAKLSVVAANLLGKGDERPFPADQLVDAGGHPVGIFGILDLPAARAADLRRWGFHTTDAAEAAHASAQSLRARGAQLVVGLFHVTAGLARVKEILNSPTVADVDVVILGHEAEGLAQGAPTMVGRTRIVHAGILGHALGRLDVRALPPGGATPTFEDFVLPLTNAIPEHPGVALAERVEIERVHMAEDQAAAALRRKNKQKEPEVYESWTYSSNESCSMCHKDQVEQWKTTDHAHALITLQKNKHDRDPACLGCHMTGYLQPGGTRRFETLMTYMANVGCESCHGPSAAHVRAIDKKQGTSRKVTAEVCLGCHTPDQNIGPFEYAEALKAVLGPGHGAPARAKN